FRFLANIWTSLLKLRGISTSQGRRYSPPAWKQLKAPSRYRVHYIRGALVPAGSEIVSHDRFSEQRLIVFNFRLSQQCFKKIVIGIDQRHINLGVERFCPGTMEQQKSSIRTGSGTIAACKILQDGIGPLSVESGILHIVTAEFIQC